jgi:[protein-PII] uridylyltransferase
MAQAEFRAEIGDWEPEWLESYIARHYPAYWLKVDLPHKIAHAKFVRAAEAEGRGLATEVGFDAARGVTELTVLAQDHPRLLSTIAGACSIAGANIVDAQIYTTTDGLALDTISISREFLEQEDEERRAGRIADTIEKALRGDLRLPEVVAKRAVPKGRLKAFAIEPEVMVNNAWSNRYTVIEVMGLDRPGLLYALTATISKLNLNIASAHVATFGERVVDVFYVTDLLGAKIEAPPRQAAIKRALIHLFQSPARQAEPAKATVPA